MQEKQKLIRSEMRKKKMEEWKDETKERIRGLIISLSVFIIFSILTGVIGYFVGLYYNIGGWGFLIGFLAPLILLMVGWYLYEECT